MQVDQLKLTVLELEDELTQLRSIHELKNEGHEKTTSSSKSKRIVRSKPDIA